MALAASGGRRAACEGTGVIAGAGPAAASRERGLGWLLVTALLVAGAAVVLVGIFTPLGTRESNKVGSDFRAVYYVAGEAVLDGRSPYPENPSDPALEERTLYAYPPQLALLVAPLSLLPIDVASVVAVLAVVASLLGALALVGVRDIRCYAALLVWGPAWNALEMANVSALLALLLALAWRFRDAAWPFAMAAGSLLSLKLFLWPIIAWAVVTRRIRGAVMAVGFGAALTSIAWATIGFAGLTTYADLLERVATQESYSITGISAALGLGSSIAVAVTFAAVLGLLALCVRYARRGDEPQALLVAVVAAFAFSPIVWLHYVVLLAVPLGILRPRFTPLWLVPVALWPLARSGNGEGIEPFVPALVVCVIALVLLVPGGARSAKVVPSAS